jgi:hypothetical protein
MKQIAIIFFLSIMILGCSETISLKIPSDEEFTLRINKDGNTPQSCIIKPDTEKFTRLLKLLNENNVNWKTEYASIFPRVSVSNSKLHVFFSGNLIVTNWEQGQYSHKIKESDYAFLNCEEKPNKNEET